MLTLTRGPSAYRPLTKPVPECCKHILLSPLCKGTRVTPDSERSARPQGVPPACGPYRPARRLLSLRNTAEHLQGLWGTSLIAREARAARNGSILAFSPRAAQTSPLHLNMCLSLGSRSRRGLTGGLLGMHCGTGRRCMPARTLTGTAPTGASLNSVTEAGDHLACLTGEWLCAPSPESCPGCAPRVCADRSCL
jgi:hypothetical protein